MAQYGVKINGFRVILETYDDMLQLDGKRNETQISVISTVLDGTADWSAFRREDHDAVDPTGAGDAVAAEVLPAIVHHHTLVECCSSD
jgi:hypothetical protein